MSKKLDRGLSISAGAAVCFRTLFYISLALEGEIHRLNTLSPLSFSCRHPYPPRFCSLTYLLFFVLPVTMPLPFECICPWRCCHRRIAIMRAPVEGFSIDCGMIVVQSAFAPTLRCCCGVVGALSPAGSRRGRIGFLCGILMVCFNFSLSCYILLWRLVLVAVHRGVLYMRCCYKCTLCTLCTLCTM